MQIDVIDFRADFSNRTRKIFSNQKEIDNYNFTFLINTAFALILTLKEESFAKNSIFNSKKVADYPILSSILSKEICENKLPDKYKSEHRKLSVYKKCEKVSDSLISFEDLKLSVLIRHIRNAMAHFRIYPINHIDTNGNGLWNSIILEDFNNCGERNMFLYLSQKEFQDLFLALNDIIFSPNEVL